MRAFLDDVYDRQLKILSYIDSEKKILSIKKISEKTKFSQKTVLQIIRKFEQDLSFPEYRFQVIYANKSIKGVYAENLDLMKIASNYTKKSVLYKMIRNIFLYEKVDAKKFCEIEFISLPTFSRYRRRLAGILKNVGLKLSRNNQIEGEELKVRNFYFSFFTYSSSQWEFSQQEYREIETHIYKDVEAWQTLDQIKQRKVCLLIFISNIRSSQKHHCLNGILTELSKRDHFEYKEVLLDYFNSKKNRTVDQTWHDLSFVQLIMWKEGLIEEKIIYDEYESYFNEENFSFIPQSNLLTGRIMQAFFSGGPGKNNEKFLRIRQEIDNMHLLFSTCYIDPSVFQFVYDPANFYYHDAAEKKIVEEVQKIADELTTSTIYQTWWNQLNVEKNSLVNYLFLIIYALLNELHEYQYDPVRIMVQNSKAFIPEIICNKLALIFGDRIKFVSNLRSEPVILITDVHLSDMLEPTREVFVSSFSNFSDINNAINEIKIEVLKQYGQRKIVKQLTQIE